MYEIEANKKSWSLLSEEHYVHFRQLLKDPAFALNPIVARELGDVQGKSILHLQCNTGADSILMARMGAKVTGVDLVPENIHYARRLAEEFGMDQVDFIESDIMELKDRFQGQYDIVMTSDGAIGWLPDLSRWAENIRWFLKEDGFFYLHDAHPFYMVFDEEKIRDGVLDAKYAYFQDEPDKESSIGGYAADPRPSENYFWVHRLGTILEALASQDLLVTYIKEYDRAAPGMGGDTSDGEGLAYLTHFQGRLPLSLSLKAEVRPRIR